MAVKKSKKGIQNIEKLNERNLKLDDWVSASHEDIEKVKARNAVMKARKEQTVTFRISGEDLEKFKDIASTKALGYQTLLASLVHQYIIGKLIEYSATTPNPLEARVERLEKKLSDKTG